MASDEDPRLHRGEASFRCTQRDGRARGKSSLWGKMLRGKAWHGLASSCLCRDCLCWFSFSFSIPKKQGSLHSLTECEHSDSSRTWGGTRPRTEKQHGTTTNKETTSCSTLNGRCCTRPANVHSFPKHLPASTFLDRFTFYLSSVLPRCFSWFLVPSQVRVSRFPSSVDPFPLSLFPSFPGSFHSFIFIGSPPCASTLLPGCGAERLRSWCNPEQGLHMARIPRWWGMPDPTPYGKYEKECHNIRQVECHKGSRRIYIECQSNTRRCARMFVRTYPGICVIECHKECQIECKNVCQNVGQIDC